MIKQLSFVRIIACFCCISIICGMLISATSGTQIYSLDDTLTSKSISELKNTNLLSGIVPSYTGIDSSASTSNWEKKLTDGLPFAASLAEANNSEIIYELDGLYSVSSFALWQGNSKTAKKVSYDVYFSCSFTTLFDSENSAFSWDAQQNLSSMGQLVSFSKTPEAKYLGIRITETCSDGCDKTDSSHKAASISEIGIWGKSAEKITFDSEIQNGKISVAETSGVPQAGESIIVEVTPDTDYQLIPGSLTYTTPSGKIITITDRATGYTFGTGNVGYYSFTMPSEPVTITACFANTAETDFLIGTLKTDLYSEDGTNEISSVNGMRFLTRIYLKNVQEISESEAYVNYDGKKHKLTELGTLISRGSKTPVIESVENNSVSGWRIVSYSSQDGICLLNDTTEQYLDYTASVATALDDMSAFRAREYTAVGYAVLDDGTVVYGRSITDNTINSMKRCGCAMPDAALYSEYNFDSYMQNYWEGNTVYNESVLFSEDSQGKICSAALMYEPLNICSVRSIDLKTEYTEGVDYIVDGKNIILTENSKIKALKYDVQYPEYASGASTDWLVTATDNTRYTALISLRNYQVAVTYTHIDGWNGSLPQPQLNLLTGTKQKLSSSENLRIVFFGDSITAGYEASGQNECAIDMNSLAEICYTRDYAPYMPAWASLVKTGLEKAWPNATITSINRAAPSSDSAWGKRNTELVTAQSPDLVVIAFGMNESSSTDSYKNNIVSIINSVIQSNAAAEFLLVSAFTPNTAAKTFQNNQLAVQEELLYNIRSELNNINIAVAPVNSMCSELLSMGKKELDGINNNLNHPNDFIIRLYAQTVLTALSDK